MAEFTNSNIVTVAAGQNVPLTETAVAGNCSIVHREGAGIVTLRGLTNQCRARYRVAFGANIAIPTGGTVEAITAALAINGEPLTSATATATPEANSPIPSGRKVKEHKRNSVAATKRAIEDFFILIPLSNCKFLRQNSPILTFNTIIRPPCAKIKNKAEYSHTLCK